MEGFLVWGDYLSELILASTSYSQQCYGKETKAQECSTFVKRQIPQIVSRNASCPFPAKDICARSSTNLRIDTGRIDPNNDFGINTALKDRFAYRNVLECAPLRTDGYEQEVPLRSEKINTTVVNYLYGGADDDWYGFDRNNITTDGTPYLTKSFGEYRLGWVQL